MHHSCFDLFCISGYWKNHTRPNFRKHVAAGRPEEKPAEKDGRVPRWAIWLQAVHVSPTGRAWTCLRCCSLMGHAHAHHLKKNVSSYARPMFHTKYPRKKTQATQVFFSNVAIDWLWPYSLIKCCQENYQAANLWSVMRGQSHPLQPVSEAICIARLPAFNCVQQNLRWWCYKLCHLWIKSLLPFPALSLTGFCNSILNAKIKWEEVL